MVLTEDQKQVKALLTETITLLCKNGLHFRSEFSIDGLIGITLDQDNVFLVSIKETIKCDSGQNNDLVHISQTKTESVSRLSPSSQSRSRKQSRTNESATSEKTTSAASETRVDFPPVKESGFLSRPEMSDVKLEYSTTDFQDDRRLGFEEPSVTNEMFSDAAMTTLAARHNRAQDISDSNARNDAAVSRHCDSLEPSRKRLRTANHGKTESAIDNVEFHDDGVTSESRVCKTEPLDVVEIPDDEMESSLNSDNSYLMYMSMYGAGTDGGAVSTDAAYSAQYDLSQMNQHSGVAGCSTWNATQRNNVFNNQDKTAANSVIENRLPAAAHGVIRANRVTKSPSVSAAAAPPPSDKVTRLQQLQRRPDDVLLQMLYRHGRYVCQLCGKRMPRERDLKAHMASKHFMAKDFCCKLCGAEYGYKYNLQQHMKIKHRVHLSDVDMAADS